MRAVVVGSMNCMPTEYAIILAKLGADVVHYYEAEEDDGLCNPMLRWGDKSAEFLKGVRLKRNPFYHPFHYLVPAQFLRDIVRDCELADLVLLSGPSISLARYINHANKKIVALSYGNDVSLYCNPAWPELALDRRGGWKSSLNAILHWLQSRFVKAQTDGLRSCTHVSYFLEGFDPQIESLLSTALRGTVVTRLPRYSINLDLFHRFARTEPLPRSAGRYKLLFPVRFSSADALYGDKGWRMLFDGLSKYRSISRTDFVCTCFEKGNYLEAQEYARQSGLDDVLEWHGVVDFATLTQYYSGADVVIEQVGSHWLSQGLWTMALGKPLIARLATPAQAEFFRTSGVLNASDPVTLANHLVACESEQTRRLLGEKAKAFVFENANMEKEFVKWGLL